MSRRGTIFIRITGEGILLNPLRLVKDSDTQCPDGGMITIPLKQIRPSLNTYDKFFQGVISESAPIACMKIFISSTGIFLVVLALVHTDKVPVITACFHHHYKGEEIS